MLPTFIRTPVDFTAAVKVGESVESVWLDFKAEVNPRDPKWQKELSRDVAQFANTFGGCLLIGIEERADMTTGLKIAAGIKPVAEPDRVREWVEQAITNHVVPSTLARVISFIRVTEGTLVAVNIPPSRSMVYVWDRNDHTIECLHRTNHGKAWMNPDEMERQMMNGSRAARLTFIDARSRATQKDLVEVVGGVWYYVHGRAHQVPIQPTFVGVIRNESDGWFEMSGAVHVQNMTAPELRTITIPFDLVRSVWVGPEGSLSLLLAARLIFSKDRQLALEPLGT